MACVIAIDQGTTSSRTLIFDESGRVVGMAQREFTQHFPRPGWVEHEAEEIWRTQAETIGEAVRKAGLGRGDIAAIGITNQRETTVMWERGTGRAVYRAIVWQDRRTAGMIEELRRAGHEEEILSKTGLVPDAYFSASKVAWVLRNVPEAKRLAGRGDLAFGTIDSWLAWKLTGGAVHTTDASNASRTMLFDIHRGEWDEGLLAMFGVPRPVLPVVVDTSGVIGEVGNVEGLEALRGVPIAAMVGDQQGALAGQLCFERGEAKTTYGTGCFMLLNTGQEVLASRHRLLTTVAARIGGRTTYALEGAVFTGGAVVQWLRDGLGIIKQSAEVEGLAGSVEDSGGVVVVPAFTGLGAPYWDPDARGMMIGVTRGTTAGHVARAALESIAHQVADLVGAMEMDSGVRLGELRVDGGATRNDLLMRIQADLLGIPVVRPVQTETTALGAAMLAGLAAGVWKGKAEMRALQRVEKVFEPALDRSAVEASRARWRRAVERSLKWERGNGGGEGVGR